jgi:MscS family membrane protein
MVDSVVDNLTLRTQRKGELRLELSLSTPAAQLDGFINSVRKILVREKIQSSSVFLDNVTGTAVMVNVDYFTAPIAIEEFNAIKQQVNLEILQLMEEMELAIAGSTIRLEAEWPKAQP